MIKHVYTLVEQMTENWVLSIFMTHLLKLKVNFVIHIADQKPV